MGWPKEVLQMECVARCMSAGDRKALKVQTRQEAELAYVAKSETQLQNQICAMLYRRGYEPIRQRMDKKSNTATGLPDIQFPCYGQSVHWEVKMPGEKPTEAQKTKLANLIAPPNSAHVRVIYSYRDAFNHLQELERKYKPTKQ